jgi:hypothetical protein
MGRESPLALPTMGTGNASVPALAKVAKFCSVHASAHNLFNQERQLSLRFNFKINRTAALAEWCQPGAA